MHLRRLLTAAAISAVALTACQPNLPSVTPTEDSPDFDCNIHGNRICGDATYRCPAYDLTTDGRGVIAAGLTANDCIRI